MLAIGQVEYTESGNGNGNGNSEKDRQYLWSDCQLQLDVIELSGTILSSLVPRPLPTREKGPVHTDCACARLSVKFP